MQDTSWTEEELLWSLSMVAPALPTQQDLKKDEL